MGLGSPRFLLGSALRRLAGRSRPSQPRPLPGTKGRHLGETFLRVFIELGGLTPDQAVLEPGCGTGRMAEPLSRYLTGSYDGFDVVREAIEECQRNIVAPNFRFRHVDVVNRFYNPAGLISPDEFEFPYPDEAFDFVFLTSVFTHMLPPEVKHYLGEIQRVLRPGGRCLATFFVLNEKSLTAARNGGSRKRFPHKGDGYFYNAPNRPEASVGYREEDVLGLLEGFELQTLQYGGWSGRPDAGPVGQDIVVVNRID
jgi:SAM-dependent methyltransferase